MTNQLECHKITSLWSRTAGEGVRQERETREKLIASGRKEFLEKGYAKASLRKICADAGVTTGALYFIFEGKEDLFRAIVEPPLEALISMIRAHFAKEKHLLLRSELYVHREGDHAAAERMKLMINFIVKGFVEMILSPGKADGDGISL